MESQSSWNEVQRAIAEAKQEHAQKVAQRIAGSSEVTAIYRKLSEKGFLKPEFSLPMK